MLRLCAALLSLAILSACAQAPVTASQNDIGRLAAEIKALDPSVDPAEAERAAYIAYTYPLQLREAYNVTDSPIVHNFKVNNGMRERGLCVHWAEDIEARLNQEGFRTLQIHRAIADGKQMRIDHSTAVISEKGGTMEQGIVLDGWRQSGRLFWAPTQEDTRYYWEPQKRVLERKYREKLDRHKAVHGGL